MNNTYPVPEPALEARRKAEVRSGCLQGAEPRCRRDVVSACEVLVSMPAVSRRTGVQPGPWRGLWSSWGAEPSVAG